MMRLLRHWTFLLPVAVVGACTTNTSYVAGIDSTPAPESFTELDASADADADASEPVAYCPSDRCPSGRRTCPNSAFLCDVDLRTDPSNCGECGNACPGKGGGQEYSCIDGRCVMTCQSGALDCDGIPDNGCETKTIDNDHCGVCGYACPADKPCIDRFVGDIGCGCRDGDTYCPGGFPICVDTQIEDFHCGACNNRCPATGDGSPRPPNTYFGCYQGECGTLKCSPKFGDCDGVPTNGCEASLTTDANCGICGNACGDGMQCRLNRFGFPECMCPQGLTFCKSFCAGDLCTGECVDLASNKDHCGTCGSACAYNVGYAIEACVYGKCERTCTLGWGDCNGNRSDGCETHIAADPKNCGACGRVCDGIAGQACVDGQCMVEPCADLKDAGGPVQ